MSSVDTIAHVRALSPFVDDLPEPAGLLHAAVAGSPAARGRITRVDTEAALASPGVRGVFRHMDIPGVNQIGAMMADEVLLAEGEVAYIGQPVVLVVAATPEEARDAAARVRIEVAEAPPVLDPREAAARGQLISPARTFSLGDVESAWERCATVVEGRVDSGGQEHLYLETQAALAIPEARGRLRIFSATQAPSGVQRAVARVLGCRMNDVEVEVQRLGGAFGGKEDQATPWAVLAALAARKLVRPVKLVLSRHEDLRVTGKRHPYSSDYRLGLDAEGRFVAFEATYYQNAGAAADLSPAILERTLFHATNAYFIPNVRVTGLSCRTNLPPFTAFRGFGGPQAMFVLEAAIAAAAGRLHVPARSLQRKNLLVEGDTFPYGMRMESGAARHSFEVAMERFGVEERAAAIDRQNAASPRVKRGLALMPVCFGISFTNTMLNQAGALVHIYTDGSVAVSTAAVEMGQGVLSKLRRIVATGLGIAETRVRLESTSTARVANMPATAASTGADLNGAAALSACRMLTKRLRGVAAAAAGMEEERLEIRDEDVLVDGHPSGMRWQDLVREAFSRRVDLTAHAFYATPRLSFDRETGKGRPFAYHVCGTAVVEAVVDVLRGTAAVESVRVIHDAGRSLDPLVDRGQAEGAIVQGIGWMTMEELVYDSQGRLVSDSLSTYKVPDLHAAPREIEVVFLEDGTGPGAVLKSKAIGEPPFMYGIGAFFAIRSAMGAVRELPADHVVSPLTNERLLMQLEGR